MAFDTFLKLEGPNVEGESTDSVHAKEIEIYSFSWGASNPTTISSYSTGAGGGKVTVSSFNIMKKCDKSSPNLFRTCCKGDHYDKATVIFRKAGGTQVEYLKYTFEMVFVESIQWSGSSGGDDVPTESVSFSYGKVTIEYKPQDAASGELGGAVIAGYDITTNTSI